MSVYHIKTIKSSFDIECDPNSTIAEVKKLIVEKNPEFDINLITLLAKKGKTFNPTKCEDDKTIGSYETDQFTLRHQRAAKSTAAKAAAAPPPKAAVAPPPKSASSPTKAAAPPPAKAAAPPPAKAAAPPPAKAAAPPPAKAAAPPPAKAAAPPPAKAAAPPPAKVAAPPPAKAAAPPPAKAATPPPSNEAAQTPSSEIAPPPKSEEQQNQPNIQETPIQEKQQTQSDHPSINQEQKQIDIPSEDRITPNNEDVIQTITKEQIPPVTTSMPNPSIPPTITSTPTPLQPNQTVHLSQTPTPSPPQSQPSDNLLDDDDDEFFSAREYNELVANFGKSPSAYADFIRFVERQNPDDAKFLKENAQALYCILRMPQFPDLSNLDKNPPQPKPQNNPSQQFTGRSNNFMQEPTFGYLNANAPGNFDNPSNSFNDNFGIPGNGMNPPPFPGGNPPSFPGNSPSFPESNSPSFPGNPPSFPGNPPSFPGNPPSFPGNPPSFPGNSPSFPESNSPSFPGNPPSFPGNSPSFPGNNSPSFPSSEINNPPFPGGGGSGGGMPNFGMPGPGSGMPSFGSPPPPPSTTSGPPTAFDLSDALSQLSQDEMDIFMKYTNSGLPLNELLNIFIEVAGKNEQTFVNILQSMK
ncbi:hypothetical protein M9Y10_008120 [Tritrichomonas musculus]|uniref:Ubiquitin-like domain-containing protein n=1 Tax=Tritrichomonas musculus TaxID=1915356 RepID=A0ABR2IXH2_9EUKA